jgi:DnaJ-class molecular chaperone
MINKPGPICWPLTAAEQEKLGGKKCPACKGKGYVPCSTKHEAGMPPESCPICEGQKGTSVMCYECAGKGRINIKG